MAHPTLGFGQNSPKPSCAKPLYLTFDTGHMDIAPLVAEVLNRQKVRVTFFAANERTRTLGVAFGGCTLPGADAPLFTVPEGMMSVGLGIHGEPGQKRMKMIPADEITAMMAEEIIHDKAYSRTVRELVDGQWVDKDLVDEPFKRGDRVIAFVNSMGGTPVAELYAVYRKLAEVCAAEGIEIVRNLIGPYITSLEMAGASLTVIRLDDELTELYDAPVRTAGWRAGA